MPSLARATTCAHQRLVASFGSVASSVADTQQMAMRLSLIMLWNKIITRCRRGLGAKVRRRRGAGAGGPAQAREPAPPRESGWFRGGDLGCLHRVEVRNWVRLVFLRFPPILIRSAGNGGVRIPGWLGGS